MSGPEDSDAWPEGPTAVHALMFMSPDISVKNLGSGSATAMSGWYFNMYTPWRSTCMGKVDGNVGYVECDLVGKGRNGCTE